MFHQCDIVQGMQNETGKMTSNRTYLEYIIFKFDHYIFTNIFLWKLYVTWYLIITLHTDAEKFDVHYFIQHRKDQVYWRGWICCFCATLLLQILVFTREFLGFRPCYFYLCFVYLLFVSSLFVWTQTQRIFEGTYIHHNFWCLHVIYMNHVYIC